MVETIACDLHVHTVASIHAYDTVRCCLEHAAGAGLAGMGIADHGPAFDGGAHPFFFTNSERLQKMKTPVRLFCGVEDDAQDGKGRLGLSAEQQERIDFVLLGCHPLTYIAGLNAAGRTRALCAAILKNPVAALTHPNAMPDFDLQAVLESAAARGTAMEVNETRVHTARPFLLKLLEECGKKNINIIVSSDAHVAEEIGVVDQACALVREIGLPDELIVNRTLASTVKFLKTHKGRS